MQSANQNPASLADPWNEYLSLLADLCRHFAEDPDVERALQRALRGIAKLIGVQAAALFTVDGQQLRCRAFVGPVDITGLTLPLEHGIVGRAVSLREAQWVRDVNQDQDFVGLVDHITGFHTKSMLCAPLIIGQQCLGAVQVINRDQGDGLFHESDFNALQALAGIVALALVNARLTRQLLEQQRLQREMELAAQVQQGLLPPSRPAPFPVQGRNVPARSVSGDFYDILPLADGRIYFAVGDVSGKGMNAALLMAKTASLFRCLGKTAQCPGELLARLNTELCGTTTAGMFVTMAAVMFEPDTGLAVIANAGHEPLLLRDGQGAYQSFAATDPPLGIVCGVGDAPLPTVKVNLQQQTLYLFTDGITEGKLAEGGRLGVEGLQAHLDGIQTLSPAERVDHLFQRLMSVDGDLHDDLTMVVLEPDAGTSHG